MFTETALLISVPEFFLRYIFARSVQNAENDDRYQILNRRYELRLKVISKLSFVSIPIPSNMIL